MEYSLFFGKPGHRTKEQNKSSLCIYTNEKVCGKIENVKSSGADSLIQEMQSMGRQVSEYRPTSDQCVVERSFQTLLYNFFEGIMGRNLFVV